MSLRLSLRRLCPAALVALVLAAVAGPLAFAADTVRVGVPAGRAFMFAVIDVGNEAGIFKKLGLDVEKVDFAGGAKLIQGMASNSVDAAVTGSSGVKFLLKGIPEKIIAETAGPPVDLALIVRDDGSITSPPQLRGQKIGVTTAGSLTEWLATRFAEHEGWGAKGVETVAVGGIQGEISALLTKQVAAIVMPTEIGLSLQEKGKAKILTDYSKVLPHWITHFIFATDAAIKAKPQALRKFVAGWFETVAYMRSHKAETIKIVTAVMKVSPKIATEAYDLEMPAITPEGRIDPATFHAFEESILPPALLAKAAKAQLIDSSFLPKS